MIILQAAMHDTIRQKPDIYHPYIFFYAPYYSRPIDYSTIDTEISSSYGEIDKNFKIFIRVDPNQIFVKNRNIDDIMMKNKIYYRNIINTQFIYQL